MSTRLTRHRISQTMALIGLTALTVTACSSGGTAEPEGSSGDSTTTPLVVLSHDSFDFPAELLAEFKAQHGIEVRIQQIGDGGELANQLVLTKDAPLGDVVYGLDNTVSYRISGQQIIADAGVTSTAKELAFAGEPGLIPIDQGDVCVNYDKTWFQQRSLAVPQTFADLAKPEYRDLLVAMNPASSTPGMAFLLATIKEYGETGWVDYWKSLKANGLKITNGWSDAFNVDYSAGEGKGKYPLMVSYGSSPAYSATEDKSDTTTGVLPKTCYRQVEYAGVISGSKKSAAAAEFVKFLLTPKVQEAISVATYMHPVNPAAKTPEDLAKFGPLSTDSKPLESDEVAKKADEWLRKWQSDVIG